jgi:mevalonate kinase
MFSFFFGQSKQLASIQQSINQLGKTMANVQEVIESVKAQQSLIAGAVSTIHALADEGLKLLQAGSTEELEALLNDVKANSDALVAATIEGTEAAGLIDAANG